MRHATLVGSLLVALFTTSVIRADIVKTITSGDFSLGYGYTAAGWTDTETTSVNIAPTGDFALSVAATGSNQWSSRGLLFPSRVLTEIPAEGEHMIGHEGYSAGLLTALSVPITASYTGAAPADASSTPNYRLTLELTGVSVGIGTYGSGSILNAQWTETTSEHPQAASVFDLSALQMGAHEYLAYYHRMEWDPTDYAVTLTGLNANATRTFGIAGSGDINDYRFMDGIEVYGRIVLSYNAVPEPSALALLGTGLLGLLAYAWRKRR